jgi:short-subunit dehydrogenase
MLTAERVVRDALRGYSKGASLVVPGLQNRLGTLGPRLLPRRAMARAAEWVARAR